MTSRHTLRKTVCGLDLDLCFELSEGDWLRGEAADAELLSAKVIDESGNEVADILPLLANWSQPLIASLEEWAVEVAES